MRTLKRGNKILPTLPGARALGVALAAALIAGGCAHGTIEGGVFRQDEGAYRVSLPPPPWTVVCAEGSELALERPDLGAAIGVNRTCDRRRTDDLLILSRGAFVGIENKRWRTREPRDLDAGPAYYSEVDGTYEGRAVRIAAYVLLDGPCILDLVFVAPPNRFDEEVSTFETMAKEFRLR